MSGVRVDTGTPTSIRVFILQSPPQKSMVTAAAMSHGMKSHG
jgi:hypothetical protein